MLHLAALDWTLYQINAEVEPANEERIRGYWKVIRRMRDPLSESNRYGPPQTKSRNCCGEPLPSDPSPDSVHEIDFDPDGVSLRFRYTSDFMGIT